MPTAYFAFTQAMAAAGLDAAGKCNTISLHQNDSFLNSGTSSTRCVRRDCVGQFRESTLHEGQSCPSQASH